MKSELELNRLEELLEFLKTEPQMDYLSYPKEVFDILYNLGIDDDLYEKHTIVESKKIKEMTLDDIKVMYSYIIRGERFCDGHILMYIEDNTLYKLLQRQIEIIKENK